MTGIRPFLALLLAGTVPIAAFAQEEPPAPPSGSEAGDESEEADIVVTAGRTSQPGAVIGDIPPEIQLSPADIRSYGVSSVTELLAELAPQTGSGQGRGGEAPVVLLNGRRVSSMREIRSIPTEAIQRVDILPEEVALKYGYTANQKVVNFVLRRRFRAVTGEVTGGTSTEGGGENGKANASLLRIRNGERLNLDVSYQRSAALREDQRDVISRALRRPYAFGGNVTALGTGSAEIDPALSALAGQPVTIAGLPDGITAPTLADLVATANRANPTDLSPYRTLSPATDALSINAVLNRTIFGNVSATLNAALEATGSRATRGLPGIGLNVPTANPYSPFASDVSLYRYAGDAAALRQTTASETAHLGLTLNGNVGQWQWTVTGNYDRVNSRTHTDTGMDASPLQVAVDAGANPFLPFTTTALGSLQRDGARAISNTGNIELVTSGSPFSLPAGKVSTTVKLGFSTIDLDSRSTRAGLERNADLSRQDGSGQINLDLPLTSRREGVLAAIGDLSANANFGADRISGFGTLTRWGYGAVWKPRDRISLIWSMAHEEGAPTVQQLGNPQVLTTAVRTFDYVTGQTVDITRLDGGNPGLRPDDRRVMKLGVTLKPFAKTDITLTANYVNSRIRNAISSLPAPTAAVEAAFPDRFVRDGDGTLLRIDNRPLNFDREDREQLRWGINFSKPIKSTMVRMFGNRRSGERPRAGDQPPPGSDAARDVLRAKNGGPPSEAAGAGGDRPEGGTSAVPPDGGSGPRREGGGGRGFGGGRNGGRIQFAIYHTVLFRDEVRISDGVPVLDLLGGDTTGAGGGSPRHQVEAQAGLSKNGWGIRASADWQSATHVRGDAGSSVGDLRFSDLTTVNLRLFANLGQMKLFEGKGWARGMRVSFSVDNLFDQRLRVRDADGATPISYQPAYLDPLGRTVKLSIRKLFF
jgi:hypothetical protein